MLTKEEIEQRLARLKVLQAVTWTGALEAFDNDEDALCDAVIDYNIDTRMPWLLAGPMTARLLIINRRLSRLGSVVDKLIYTLHAKKVLP